MGEMKGNVWIVPAGWPIL